MGKHSESENSRIAKELPESNPLGRLMATSHAKFKYDVSTTYYTQIPHPHAEFS